MNVQLLIDAIMRQTTVLIAQLATSGGVRAPLSHIANQVFLDLSSELHAQGISRKVSADMFGMALRAYIRKLNRLSESATERGESLWQAVLTFVRERPVASRAEVLTYFCQDDATTVRGILRDLTESGVIFSSGSGDCTVFRAMAEEEASYTREHHQEGTTELLSVLIYREGPFERATLRDRAGMSEERLEASLQALVADGQIQVDAKGRVSGARFLIPLTASKGWEAAFLDHYHALVRTLCTRLEAGDRANVHESGGATYTFEVWPGHPDEQEVKGTIARIRRELSALRERVDAYNGLGTIPERHDRVVCYAGQHISPWGSRNDE